MDPGHKARDDRVRLVSNDEKASLTLWRKFTAAYAALLSWLLVLSVAILVIPVSLQIFSRYTALIPSYIWTEEMARFLFIWTIMIGAMIGVRESTHFEVDVWPQLSRRGEAMVRLAGRLGVLAAGLRVRVGRYPVHAFCLAPHLRARRPPALAHSCRLARHRRHLDRLPRRADDRRSQDHSGETRMTGAVLSPGVAAIILFGMFFLLMFLRVPVAFALGLACLPILVIEPRLDTMTLMQETFNAYNSFILLAVPFFLLTANLMNVGGTTDRLMTLSRTMVGHFPGSLAQINVVLSIFFAGISGSSTADAASQSKIFIEAQTKEGYDLSFSVAITAVSAVLAVIIPPSILMIVWGGLLTVSIGALFLAGIMPGPADRLCADGHRARLCQGARLSDLSALDLARAPLRHLDCHPRADDARHHHRRQDLRLVHGHRVGLHRRALRRRAVPRWSIARWT